MAGKAGALIIRFIGDTKHLDRSSLRVTKTLGRVASGVAIAGVAAAGAVAAVAVATTKDLIRVERLGKATENVIKATGGAAGRTKRQVDRQAESLERLTGAERETVTEGQNMLLTFKNIKGKQFDEATRAALDMGVAMNKGSLVGLDLQDTSIKLGKALNDPIKGISTLSRVGVTFTEQQKAQIKTMVEAGNVTGAQKVILRELRSEFGGAAKAAGMSTEGMAAKIRNSFGNIAEKVMSGTLPMLQKVMTWVNDKVLPAMVRLGDWLKGPGAVHLQRFGDGIRTLIGVFASVVKWIIRNRDVLSTLAVMLGVAVTAWKLYIFYTVGIPKIMAAARASIIAATAAVKALNLAMRANVIGIVITAIAALVAGLIWFFTKTTLGKKIWKGFATFLMNVTGNVVKFFRKAWNWILNAIQVVWKWIRKNWPLLLGILLGPVGLAVVAIIKNWKKISTAFQAVWHFIRDKVFAKLRLGLVALRESFRAGRQRVTEHFDRMRDRLFSVWRWVRDKVFLPIARFITRQIPSAFKSGVSKVRDFWEGLKRAAAKPVNFLIKWIWNKGLRNVLNAIPGVNLPPVREVRFDKGGPVRGGIPGRDSVRAWLKPNEHVWTDKEVAAVGGHQVMKQMRNAALKGNLNGDPKFAEGGSLSMQAIVHGQRFARSQAGKPYGWGAVGPWAYDCSGFMSAITNVLNNAYPHTRRGSTGTFPWLGFKRGPGEFTIGSTPNYAHSGVGHMAGTLGGMNVESRGGRGVIVGSGALGATHGGFSEMAHLGRPGLGAMRDSSGGWLSTIGDVLKAMRKLPGQITELMSGGSWISTFLKKLAAGLWSEIATYINNKIPDWGPIPNNPIPRRFQRGGLVRARPGGTHIIAGEGGYDERIVPMGGPYAPRVGGPMEVNINIDGKRVAKVIIDPLRREIKNISGGDVQAALGKVH